MSNAFLANLSGVNPSSPQDLVITLLGTYVHPRDRMVWSGGLVTILGDFGFSRAASRIALTRLVNRGLLVRVRSGRHISYRLTDRTRRLLEEGDRRIFSLGRSAHEAELWTVLWHSIPEERRLERTRLARRLRFLGFASLQDGTWISPHNREREVLAILEELGMSDRAGVLLGRPAESLDFRPFVGRLWDMEALAERYESYVAEFGPYANERSRLKPRDAFLIRTRAVHVWRQFPADDPELPDSLMPGPPFRVRAVEVFERLFEELAEPTEAYFWQHAGASVGKLLDV